MPPSELAVRVLGPIPRETARALHGPTGHSTLPVKGRSGMFVLPSPPPDERDSVRDATDAIQDGQPGRRLSWPWFLAVVVVYAGIIQGLGLLIGVDTSYRD